MQKVKVIKMNNTTMKFRPPILYCQSYQSSSSVIYPENNKNYQPMVMQYSWLTITPPIITRI